jgi:acetyl esterase
MSDDAWFAALRALTTLPPRPLSSDPALAALLTPVDPGDWKVANVDVTEAAAPGPHGNVPVRVYRPEGEPEGWFVWVHGGAWAFGDLDLPEADATAREVCERGRRVVVSVDYRLAVNGLHYPVPLDDVVAAMTWAVAQADGPVALGGASAGANLVAGATLRLRDEGGAVPSKLLLIYPLLHPVLPRPSEELGTKLATLSPVARFDPAIYQAIVQNYLGGLAEDAPAYAMPSLADLTGLPPTLVHNCEYDALRASGEAFAEQLDAAGVPLRLSCAPEVPHGHLSSPWLAQFSATIDEMVSFLRDLG